MQFLQMAYTPEGGSTDDRAQQRVHRGFAQSWYSIKEPVLALVGRVVRGATDPATVRVTACGHSLGGAISTLAAYDIACRFQLRPDQIQCYTFGCPRVGNHAFAAAYGAAVPDTWHLINEQGACLLRLLVLPGSRFAAQ